MQVRRVAMVCVHTSPLEQPGTGDAGGLNVYVSELSGELAARGVEVDLFTRATRSDQPPVVAIAPGVRVRHVLAGPFARTDKLALTGELCSFAAEVMRMEAARGPGYYDVVHSHYWLSGQAGAIVRARWGIPLVHSMHTLAKVKNASLPYGDLPEPAIRLAGETDVAYSADRLVANSESEARALISLYGADPARVVTVHPGVNLDLFRPGDRAQARQLLGVPVDGDVLLFVGRLQALKAPDMVLRAAAELLTRDPRRQLSVVMVGGPSGTRTSEPGHLSRLADELGVPARLVPPVDRGQLVDWYRAADVTVVPSRSETFGLVALESQASGTPVVAASVGGLQTAVRHGHSGLLVTEHEPAAYADAIQKALGAGRLRGGARSHAERFSWNRATERLLGVYADARRSLELAPAPQAVALAG